MIRRLFDHFGWRLLSLAAALLLWAGFAGRPELVTFISVPIEYQNMPDRFEMSSDVPQRVLLEVRGPSVKLHDVDQWHSAVVLNLAGVREPGEQTFTIERRHIELPAGLTVVRTTPGQLRLRFEHRLQAEVPVRVRFASPPPQGYRVGHETVSPKELEIVGPESRVRQVAEAETDPIDLSHVAGTAEFNVHTFVADPQVRFHSSPNVKVVIMLEKTTQGGAPSDGQTTVRD